MNGYKTYIGIIITIVPIIAGFFGYEASTEYAEGAEIVLNDLVSLVGAGIATYGRLVSTVPGLLSKKEQ